MPIYAYRCDECHFAKDVLQKMSDPQLTVCLSCGKASFKKQLTAAGFQLKGTGWYATNFRGGNNASDAAKTDSPKPSAPADTSAPAATPAVQEKSTAAPVAASAASPAPVKAVSSPGIGH